MGGVASIRTSRKCTLCSGTLNQWFSNLSVYQNQLEYDLLKHRLLDPIPEFLISRSGVGPKNLVSNKFPGNTDAGVSLVGEVSMCMWNE